MVCPGRDWGSNKRVKQSLERAMREKRRERSRVSTPRESNEAPGVALLLLLLLSPPHPTLHSRRDHHQHTMSNDPSRAEKVDDSATAILRPKKRCVSPSWPGLAWPRHPSSGWPHTHPRGHSCTRSPNRLVVDESTSDDNSVAQLHPATMELLQLFRGDTIIVRGKKRKDTGKSPSFSPGFLHSLPWCYSSCCPPPRSWG